MRLTVKNLFLKCANIWFVGKIRKGAPIRHLALGLVPAFSSPGSGMERSETKWQVWRLSLAKILVMSATLLGGGGEIKLKTNGKTGK